MYNIIKLHENDNVAVAPMTIPANANIYPKVTSINSIPFGHKIALSKIKKDNLIDQRAPIA